MKAKQVYRKYNIPPNLQRHMLQVASLAKIISDHWIGPEINEDRIIKVCLIHDMGNLLRFAFREHLDLWGEEKRNLDKWKKIRDQMEKKYGPNEQLATLKIAKEIGADERMLFLIKNKSFRYTDKTAKSDDWELKIITYAGQRIGPSGLLTLKQRFEEIKDRHKNRVKTGYYLPGREVLIQSAFKLELAIQKYLDIDLSKLFTKEIDNFNTLRNYPLISKPQNVTAKQIYIKYRVPLNIQVHMLQVANLAQWIVARWQGPNFDTESVIKACLIHDIGNLVIDDLGGESLVLKNNPEGLTYWKKVKDRMIKKYGNNEHEVTLRIAKEIGMERIVISLLRNMSFSRTQDTLISNSWERKICTYVNQRVGPNGIISLQERFADVKRRYQRLPNASINLPNRNELINYAFEIEQEIKENVDIDLKQVTEKSIEENFDLLSDVRI